MKLAGLFCERVVERNATMNTINSRRNSNNMKLMYAIVLFQFAICFYKKTKVTFTLSSIGKTYVYYLVIVIY